MKFFKPERGWGAISSPALPVDQDAWVHHSEIQGTGYRMLTAGDRVEFDVAAARQDSFRFVATRVRRLGPGSAPTLRRLDGQVRIVPAGTPDTPLTPKRGGRGGSAGPPAGMGAA